MARIKGIDLPKNKRGVIGLTYIYGIGLSYSKSILKEAKVSEDIKVQDWTDDQTNAIRSIIADKRFPNCSGGWRLSPSARPANARGPPPGYARR